MTYRCELKERQEQPALSVRTRAADEDLPEVVGKTYGAIMRYLEELGEQPVGMPFAAYYNMDVQNLDVEIGFPVARELVGNGEIQPSALPGGKVASALHVGPYDQLGAAYEALAEWTKVHGYETSGVSYEFYYEGPETPPDELRTEILFPLKTS